MLTDPTKTTVTRFTVISNPNPNPNPPRKRVVGRESTLEIVGEKPADFADCVYDRELYSKPAETVPHRHKFGVVPVGTNEGRAAATGSRPAVVGAPSLSVVRLSEKHETSARALAEQIVRNHAALCKTRTGMAHQPMVVSFDEPDTNIVYNRAVQILAMEYDCHVASYARIGHGTSQVQVDPRFHHDPDYSDVGC